MTRKLTLTAVVAVVLALTGWTGAAACEKVRVVDGGDVLKLGAGHTWSFNAEGAEEFDVADLADGETRVFGEGDHQVTVSRQGDEVTIQHPPRKDGAPMSIVCHLDDDVCKILTLDEGPARTAIMIRKSSDCAGDDDCTRVMLTELSLGDEPARILIRKKLDCAGDDCAEADATVEVGGTKSFATVQVVTDGMELDGEGNVVMLSKDAGAFAFTLLGDDDAVVLRCPEGDTTMRVDREEAGQTWLCPKHSVPLEKVSTAVPHKIKVIKKRGDD